MAWLKSEVPSVASELSLTSVLIAYCASLCFNFKEGDAQHGMKSYVDGTGALFFHLSNIFLLHRLQTCTRVLSLSPHLLWYVFKLY